MHRYIYLLISLLLCCNIAQAQDLKFSPEDSLDKKENYNLDTRLFRSINNSRNAFLDATLSITDKSVLPVSIALPVVTGGISRANKNYYNENSAILLALSEMTGLGITAGLKYLIKRERPYLTLPSVYYKKDNSPTDRYSFPSGHTTIAFAIATSLTLRYPDEPLLIAGSFLYAGIIGYGRIYLGVHYPSDVIGGMVTGAGSAALIYAFRAEIIKFKNNLFNEEGNSDRNYNSANAGLMFAGLFLTDLLNYKFGTSKSKILRNSTVRFDGATNSIGFGYNF